MLLKKNSVLVFSFMYLVSVDAMDQSNNNNFFPIFLEMFWVLFLIKEFLIKLYWGEPLDGDFLKIFQNHSQPSKSLKKGVCLNNTYSTKLLMPSETSGNGNS